MDQLAESEHGGADPDRSNEGAHRPADQRLGRRAEFSIHEPEAIPDRFGCRQGSCGTSLLEAEQRIGHQSAQSIDAPASSAYAE